MVESVEFAENLIDAIERNFNKEMCERFEKENFVHYKISIPATCASIRVFYYTNMCKNKRWKHRNEQYQWIDYILNNSGSKWEQLNLDEKISFLFFEQLDSIFVRIHKSS